MVCFESGLATSLGYVAKQSSWRIGVPTRRARYEGCYGSLLVKVSFGDIAISIDPPIAQEGPVRADYIDGR